MFEDRKTVNATIVGIGTTPRKCQSFASAGLAITEFFTNPRSRWRQPRVIQLNLFRQRSKDHEKQKKERVKENKQMITKTNEKMKNSDEQEGIREINKPQQKQWEFVRSLLIPIWCS